MKPKKIYPKSYKEKTNPYPSGEGKGRTMGVISHPLPPINENGEFEYTDYNAKEEISSVFGDSAYDLENDTYDYVDYKLGNTKDIDKKKLEILKDQQNKKIKPQKNTKKETDTQKEIPKKSDIKQKISKEIVIEKQKTSKHTNVKIFTQLTEAEIIQLLNFPQRSIGLPKVKNYSFDTGPKYYRFLKNTKAKNSKRKGQYRNYRAN